MGGRVNKTHHEKRRPAPPRSETKQHRNAMREEKRNHNPK